MKLLFGVPLLALALYVFASTLPEAPTGFDNKTNGLVDDATHAADQTKFDEIENIPDGLGPLYNAQSCRECHQTLREDPARSVNCALGIAGPMASFRIRRFLSITAVRSLKAAIS